MAISCCDAPQLLPVATKPGFTALQLTPKGAPSSATQRVRPSRPDFDAQ